MKKSWLKRLCYSLAMSGTLVILFQNCGPAQLTSQGETLATSTSPAYSDPSSTSSTSSTPTPTPSSTPTTIAPCAPLPSSNFVVNVKNSGALGNGLADDTAAIQSAINQVAGTGGTVFVPAGTYMINALTSVNLGSNMTLRLDAGAELQAIANNATTYTVVAIYDKSNVNIVGGTVSGERNAHIGTSGQWGMGIKINGGTNIVVENTTVRNAWGDGLYVGFGTVSTTSTNVSLCSVKASNNRRQGLAIITVNGLLVQNSIFENSNGTAPSAGINFAPSRAISNVIIKNSQIVSNQGLAIFGYDGSTATISNIAIEANKISNNGGGIQLPFVTNSRITNNTISDSVNLGIHLYLGATGNTVSNNDITVTGAAAGRALLIDPGNTVIDNTLR